MRRLGSRERLGPLSHSESAGVGIGIGLGMGERESERERIGLGAAGMGVVANSSRPSSFGGAASSGRRSTGAGD